MALPGDLEGTFGTMPFDHFLVEHWEVELLLQKKEQERRLVKTRLGLGRIGRHAYYKRCMEVFNIAIPDHIPRDSSAFEKRTSVDPERWGSAWAIWIRTWYGDEKFLDSTSINETVRRTSSADEAYSRLWKKALHPVERHGEYDEGIVGPLVFDNDATAYGVVSRDADDEIELMEEIPPFVLSAFMRCPDAMDGSSEASWSWWLIQTTDELASSQALLALVADREACENGWVLMIALNHKGQVLHMRRRCKACDVSLNITFWRDGGEPLDIVGEKENAMDYRDANRSGDGWDDDTAR